MLYTGAKLDCLARGVTGSSLISNRGLILSVAVFSLIGFTASAAELNSRAVSEADLQQQKDNVGLKQVRSEATDSLSCVADENNSYLDNRSASTLKNRQTALASINERLLKSCLIGTKEVKRRLLSNSVLMIDIRSQEDFESYRIPNSINLSTHEIKVKEFFKRKHLVLVGDKSDLFKMGQACKELRQQGFKKVNFLADSVGTWEGGLVGGDVSPTENFVLEKISPRKFVSLKSKMKWLVLNLHSEDRSDVSANFFFEGVEVVPFSLGNQDDLKRVKEFMSSVTNQQLYGILVVSENGDDYFNVAKNLVSNNVKNIVYMEGGVESYKKYLVNRQVFLARLKRGPTQRRSCSSI